MEDIQIIAIDIQKRIVKKTKVNRQDLFAIVNRLEKNQILIIEGVNSIGCFLKRGRIIGLQMLGSIRSIIESL